MNMLTAASVVFACACCALTAGSQLTNTWRAQRDNLSEYLIDRTVSAQSHMLCAALAREAHHAVWYSAGSCRMLICRLGWSGCRKCRNAVNSSQPLLMVKRLDTLELNWCWRTFQHRVDASVDFNRNWLDYLSSFGQNEDGNYWMGLEAIHQLTQAGDRRVRWEMSAWNGSWWWWENAYFIVQGSSQGYRVLLGNQDVTRSNVLQCPSTSLQFMNNSKFSTYDRDQDSSPNSCANAYGGAWWYNCCYCINPNGRYYQPPAALNLPSFGLTNQGISFLGASPYFNKYPLDYSQSMKTFECLVMDYN